MKTPEWRKDGMKQIIHTGCKEFDKYIVAVTTGNVTGGGQESSYIRPYNELECNGITNKPGHLQSWDLKGFKDLPQHVEKYVRSVTVDKSVILYEFYHYNRNYNRRSRGWYRSYHAKFITHGYVITDYDNHLMKYFVTGPTYKSYDVIQGVIPYITQEIEMMKGS